MARLISKSCQKKHWIKCLFRRTCYFSSSRITHAKCHNHEGASNQFWSQQQRLCHHQTSVSSVLHLLYCRVLHVAEKLSAGEQGLKGCSFPLYTGLLFVRLNSKWKLNIDFGLIIWEYRLCPLIWDGTLVLNVGIVRIQSIL